MPTSRQKREQHASRCDAARGQQVMDRLVRVVQREQRLQAQPGVPDNVNFNSQPQAGWRREWKTAAAQKGALMGPDLAWTDDQSWLQGSKACYDVGQTCPSARAAGYAGVLALLALVFIRSWKFSCRHVAGAPEHACLLRLPGAALRRCRFVIKRICSLQNRQHHWCQEAFDAASPYDAAAGVQISF